MREFVTALFVSLGVVAAPGNAAAQSDTAATLEESSSSESEPPGEPSGPPAPETPTGETDTQRDADRGGDDPRSTPGNECSYHVDCPDDHLCVRGSCERSENVVEKMTAREACGQNRRCRLERLERRNRARRHAQMLEEERELEAQIEQFEEDELADYPRLDRPFSADLRFSRFGLLGLSVGYTFFGHLRAELQFAHHPAYDVSTTIEGREFSGSQNVNWFTPGLVYFFTDGVFAPYGGLSFVYGFGSYEEFGAPPVDDRRRRDTDAAVDTEYHALELKAGVDYQMREMGAHLRLGLAYRPLIYNQARLGPGQYADLTRRGMEDWFGSLAQIDVMLLAGWAF